MPGFDATGPQGQGAMTGWRHGRCGGDVKVRGGFQGRGGGRGGRGFHSRRCGSGQGRQGFTIASARAAQASDAAGEVSTGDLKTLRSEVQACAQTLERISAQMTALEAQPVFTEPTES